MHPEPVWDLRWRQPRFATTAENTRPNHAQKPCRRSRLTSARTPSATGWYAAICREPSKRFRPRSLRLDRPARSLWLSSGMEDRRVRSELPGQCLDLGRTFGARQVVPDARRLASAAHIQRSSKAKVLPQCNANWPATSIAPLPLAYQMAL